MSIPPPTYGCCSKQANHYNQRDPALLLPPECFQIILTYLPLQTIGRCACVSAEWRCMVDNVVTWSFLCRRLRVNQFVDDHATMHSAWSSSPFSSMQPDWAPHSWESYHYNNPLLRIKEEAHEKMRLRRNAECQRWKSKVQKWWMYCRPFATPYAVSSSYCVAIDKVFLLLERWYRRFILRRFCPGVVFIRILKASAHWTLFKGTVGILACTSRFCRRRDSRVHILVSGRRCAPCVEINRNRSSHINARWSPQ